MTVAELQPKKLRSGRPPLPPDLREAREKISRAAAERRRTAKNRARRQGLPEPKYTKVANFSFAEPQLPTNFVYRHRRPKPSAAPAARAFSTSIVEERYHQKLYAEAWLTSVTQSAVEHGLELSELAEKRSVDWFTESWSRMRHVLPVVKLAEENAHVIFPSEKDATHLLQSGIRTEWPIVTSSPLPHIYQNTEDFIDALGNQFRAADIIDSASIWKGATIKQRKAGHDQETKVMSVDDMKARIFRAEPSNRCMNWLDIQSLEEKARPKYLDSHDANLLSLLQADITRTLNHHHDQKSNRSYMPRGFSDMTKWTLISEAGNPTKAHQDGCGFETFITVVKGEIMFCWPHHPSKSQVERWAEDPDTANEMDWRSVVLSAGDTIYFQPGTIHIVLRLCNDELKTGHWGRNGHTYATGGHLLRRSNIARSVKVLSWQMQQTTAGRSITNEEVLQNGTNLLSSIYARIAHVSNDDSAKEWGGIECVREAKDDIRSVVDIMRKAKAAELRSHDLSELDRMSQPLALRIEKKQKKRKEVLVEAMVNDFLSPMAY